ncbi:MAG TPA: protein-glutamate O-methyltransferase [Desulfatiglandales bacterium]|nr:protein-glutamate O-methyltransferase [Desulfatiglandales bacterium]
MTNDLPFIGQLTRRPMTNRTFSRFSEFIHTECGIKMPPTKKTMLEARLSKRLRSLGMDSFEDYCDYVFSTEGFEGELANMVEVVTTNKTDFFREPKHFDYLLETALPAVINARGPGESKKVGVWSAGCSTGEEPYTLAMVLNEFAEQCRGFRYSILATDISMKVLEKAAMGIYEEANTDPIPPALQKKYLMKSKDRSKGFVRIVPELRSAVRFRRLNFMDGDFGIREPLDIIFCRNVIIYFDRPTQEMLLNRLCRYLIHGGYIFMGHSETLNGLDVPLALVTTTVYRKQG